MLFRSHIPKWAGNKISHAHGNTNIFIRFATAAFATSGQSYVRLKIALDMSQGYELAYNLKSDFKMDVYISQYRQAKDLWLNKVVIGVVFSKQAFLTMEQ